MKALAKGKHVLLEKPSSNTASETRKMFELAEQKGLILLEAFHYRYVQRRNRLRLHKSYMLIFFYIDSTPPSNAPKQS
jgi:predicted dehydrogenase